MGRAGRRPPGRSPGRAPRRGAPRCCAAGACGRLPAPCTSCKRGTGPPLAPAPTQLPAGGRAGESRGCCVWENMCRRRGRPQAARASPGQGAPQGRPRCCAAGACGRLPAPCTGCKRGTGPPLAPAPTRLPAGGRAGESRGCCVWENMCRRRGRPQAARASPGQGAPQGRPRCCAAGACGRLPAPCTGCKRGTGPPLAPAPTRLPAEGGALSPGSAGELANAAVLLQIVRRHSIFGHFSCRTA